MLPQGGEYTVEGVMDTDEPPEKVYDLLADYDRVASVFSNVLQSTTHAAEGADTTLKQVLPGSSSQQASHRPRA